MRISSVLIANRGEIAVRIARAAAELGLRTVAAFSEDDAHALHVRKADEARPLRGQGVAAYLDSEQLLALARATGCEAVHPGYGFLSENAQFARRYTEEGLIFVGPQARHLELFGDKAQARKMAQQQGIPVLAGTSHATSLEEAREFLASLRGGAVLIKALAGGGGRGMRVVSRPEELAEAYARCQSEARAAFGQADVYVEQLLRPARHIEVQVVGDGRGGVMHLWERECTLQRRHQKLVEVAPSPGLPAALRERLTSAAVRLARAVEYLNLGTFEFLVDAEHLAEDAPFFFMEANPRLQVEHTVTEELTGIDLVKTQFRLADGRSLADVGLAPGLVAEPKGYALQVRVNMETLDREGNTHPTGGTLTAFEAPSGPGIRVDTFAYAGYTPSPHFDSLLAKVIARVPAGEYTEVLARAYRALCELRIEGVPTNLPFLQNLLRHEDVLAHRIHTRFVDEHLQALLTSEPDLHQRLYFSQAETRGGGQQEAPRPVAAEPVLPEGLLALAAPHRGTVVALDVQVGDALLPGQRVAVLEAMKMEFLVEATTHGVVHRVLAKMGETVAPGQALFFVEPHEATAEADQQVCEVDLDTLRPDLQEVQERHALEVDATRPQAVERRRKSGQRTIRENIADLCDPESFLEYGALALAAQRRRRSLEDLIKISPADGLVAGIGSVNGDLFPAEQARCMVLGYDYTVFAGTQGMMNHKKTDRLIHLAQEWQIPLVLFAEGGGGRPGDTDWPGVAGLDNMTFMNFAKLSGQVPLVGIVSGRCFAGNAALLGCCDVIIATENATLGMGGPAMIEGGGLGIFAPEEVGPVSMQAPNGVIDIVVTDEAEAVRVAKHYLSYMQGDTAPWTCVDQRRLRQLIPENRLRVYDVRKVIETLADEDSVLELRRQFGIGMITALTRIEGRPFGVLANNPLHLGGAIDADAADKAARFMQLCDAFGLPILSLCDTPGFMVGPDAEKTATVRHVSRMFVTAGSLRVPFFCVVLRKGYGLGAQAMAGGSFHAPFAIISWPSGEFGGMGLEGAVRLGYRKELEAISDPQERQARFTEMVNAAYQQGKAINMASYLEIDEVIDPKETRRWLSQGLRAMPTSLVKTRERRSFIDTW